MALAPVRVFYSYTQRDAAFRDELETHLALLRRQGLIEGWHNRQIVAGEPWQDVVDQKLGEAELILLLVSSSFVASDYIYSTELRVALERQAKGQVRVVPILVRPVDLAGSELARLKPLPSNGRPVSTWPDQDEAWLDVAQGIRSVVQILREPIVRSAVSPAVPPAPADGTRPAGTSTAGSLGASRSGNVVGVAPATSPPSRIAGADQKLPTSASLRKAINKAIDNDPEFDAFCHDHFGRVHQRYTVGMERTIKTNLLLQLADRRQLLNALREEFPDYPYDELIRYESE